MGRFFNMAMFGPRPRMGIPMGGGNSYTNITHTTNINTKPLGWGMGAIGLGMGLFGLLGSRQSFATQSTQMTNPYQAANNAANHTKDLALLNKLKDKSGFEWGLNDAGQFVGINPETGESITADSFEDAMAQVQAKINGGTTQKTDNNGTTPTTTTSTTDDGLDRAQADFLEAAAQAELPIDTDLYDISATKNPTDGSYDYEIKLKDGKTLPEGQPSLEGNYKNPYDFISKFNPKTPDGDNSVENEQAELAQQLKAANVEVPEGFEVEITVDPNGGFKYQLKPKNEDATLPTGLSADTVYENPQELIDALKNVKDNPEVETKDEDTDEVETDNGNTNKPDTGNKTDNQPNTTTKVKINGKDVDLSDLKGDINNLKDGDKFIADDLSAGVTFVSGTVSGVTKDANGNVTKFTITDTKMNPKGNTYTYVKDGDNWKLESFNSKEPHHNEVYKFDAGKGYMIQDNGMEGYGKGSNHYKGEAVNGNGGASRPRGTSGTSGNSATSAAWKNNHMNRNYAVQNYGKKDAGNLANQLSSIYHVDNKQLKALIIRENPSIFKPDGSIKPDADWSKLDLPSESYARAKCKDALTPEQRADLSHRQEAAPIANPKEHGSTLANWAYSMSQNANSMQK